MRDLNIRIKQKFNEVIPFDEKGTTWASFLNILITSKKPEDVMKYLGVYEAEEIDAMIDDLSSFCTSYLLNRLLMRRHLPTHHDPELLCATLYFKTVCL